MQLRSSLLLALASCNAVYGLVEPARRDGGYFDVSPDVPFTCPNGVVPEFNHAHLEQMIAQNCVDYTRTEAPVRALARCGDVVMEGLPDQPLSAASGLETVANMSFQRPRISPEGDQATMLLVNEISGSFMAKVVIARRTDTGWIPAAEITTNNTLAISELTRGPNAHVLLVDASPSLQEYVDTGTSWKPKGAPFTVPNLLASSLHMSPDGLRIWWSETLGIDYADRPTIDDVFVPRGLIPHTLGFNSPFITADCGRVYFSTLQSIWIAGQQPP